MKDTPLLMKGPLVCATQEDRKTQTRRLNGLNIINFDAGRPSAHMWKYKGVADAPLHLFEFADGINGEVVKCPYGKQGDRLWLRETWKAEKDIYKGRPCISVYFKASPDIGKVVLFEEDILPSLSSINKWKSSIHMFRWASRINLEITAIRVERVQEISEKDAEAEGIEVSEPAGGHAPALWYFGGRGFSRGYYAFHALWDSINAKRGYPWKDNPWVWVVEFKRVTG